MSSIQDVIVNIAGAASSAHAYIVEGRSGSVRDGFIRELSMGLECTSPDVRSRPCGVCDACRQASAGSSMDIVHMQMSGKNGYKTEDANAFAARLDMGCYGRSLIGIIDDADSLSETVQNKLLKTLEEPGDNVIILLGSSNPDVLLSTVRSRCSIIRIAENDAEVPGRTEDSEALEKAASLMAEGSAFHEFREAVDKAVKTKSDAAALIDIAEDRFRQNMISGEDAGRTARMLESAERTRADIEQGMDKNKALKRLFLELGGR